jgi:hypothetical protein
MKLLLDENLPHDFRYFLPGHDVFTVAYMQWAGVRNGDLLARAASAGFDAMISLDAGLEYQQNLASLPIAVILLKAPSNMLNDLKLFVPSLLDALAALKPKTLVSVG